MSFDIAIIKSDIAEVSTVAVTKNGKILMGKRRDSGRWTMPGGHLNKDEDPVDGAVRELFEEAGLKIKPKELKHLKTQKIVSELGKNLVIHAYEYDDWDGMEKPTPKNDPDKEVAKWEWIDFDNGLPEEVKSNLHAKKNVALIALGLMKGLIMEDTAKGGPGSGIRGHHTDVAGESSKPLRQPDTESGWDESMKDRKQSVFYISPGRKLKNRVEDDKIKQKEEESWKKLMAEAAKNKSISLVVDLVKGMNGHKYLRKYKRGDRWVYIYYEPGHKPRRLEDKAMQIISRMAELGDPNAKSLIDSVQEHPELKITALRAAARQGLTEAAKKLRDKYGIDHKQEEMEDALIPAVATPRDQIHQPMSHRQKEDFKGLVNENVDKMIHNLNQHRSNSLHTRLAKHGITKEKLTEGLDAENTLHGAFKRLHENLKHLDTAHEGLRSGNSMTSSHEGSYANMIYNNALSGMEAKNHLPERYASLHKRTVDNRGGDFQLTPASELAERQRRLEQEANERRERERREAEERQRRENEEVEREEAGLSDTVGYHMANMLTTHMSRIAKVNKAKEINRACETIFGKALTKEEFPYNFHEHGLKTVITHLSVSGGFISMDMEIHDGNGRDIMDGFTRTWSRDGGRPHINNSYMMVRSEYRGGLQVGSLINQGQRRLLRSLPDGGVVSVRANCDVGGYNWANQGFSFAHSSYLMSIRNDFRTFLSMRGVHLTDAQMEKFTDPVHFAAFTDGKKHILYLRSPIQLSQTQKDSGSISGVPGEHSLTSDEIATGMTSRMAVHLGKKFMLSKSWIGRWDSRNETDASRYAEHYYQMRERAAKVLNDEYKGLVGEAKEGKFATPPARAAVAPTPTPQPASQVTGDNVRSTRAQNTWTITNRRGARSIRMTIQRIANVARWDDANFNHFMLTAPISRAARVALRAKRREIQASRDVPF